MTEQVVVDVSRVYDALDLTHRGYVISADRARVAVAKERAEVTVKMIKYGAAACALIIVSIGLAIWLARQRHVTQINHPGAIVHLPTTTAPSGDIGTNKVMTKVVLFNSIEGERLHLANRNIYDLVAGHEYINSNSDRWENAWCYATFLQDGMRYRVDLVLRTQNSLTTQMASSQEMRQLGLSEDDIASLRRRCPWRQQ